jgi:hypothetical protein
MKLKIRVYNFYNQTKCQNIEENMLYCRNSMITPAKTNIFTLVCFRKLKLNLEINGITERNFAKSLTSSL